MLTSGGAIDVNASAPADSVVIDSSGNVGIGTNSPSALLMVEPSARTTNFSASDYTTYADILVKNPTDDSTCATGIAFITDASTYTNGASGIACVSGSGDSESSLAFITRPLNAVAAERMRIDSSGNLMVGTTSAPSTPSQVRSVFEAPSNGTSGLAVKAPSSHANGVGTPIVAFDFLADNYYGDSGKWGLYYRISAENGNGTYSDRGQLHFQSGYGGAVSGSAGIIFSYGGEIRSTTDNAADVGTASYRWDDVYATNGTIQTSDRNEKQDIEALSDAEQRVAVACKGLLRKFRWKDAVAEKGDDARIHFGIIAQDLQDAFAAEGLDAGRYAMFISSTWWETQTEVPAVEAVEAQDAVYDDEGNLVSEAVEAVEAKEAYTRTDTYDTAEEAPEGATERTRLGVRYPELLAFIIAAI